MIFLLWIQIALAHYVGSEPWCVQLSETHFVCEYKDMKECEAAVVRTKSRPSFFVLPSEENSKPVEPKCIYREIENEKNGRRDWI